MAEFSRTLGRKGPSREEWIRALEERHGAERQARFTDACVAICGLGGLGSNVAVALTRAGVGKLILIDFDIVDISNLNRQQYKASQIGKYKTEALSENLREISAYTELETYAVRLDEENIPEIMQDVDVICEAFDEASEKSMLVNTILESVPETPVVCASGMAGFGSANAIRTAMLTDRLYLCGDGTSDIEDGSGLAASRVMACAAHEAHMILRLLSGETEP